MQGDNAELQSKLSDFEAANNDMKNLLNSTEIATLYLNKEINIRRFTDTVIKIFKIRIIDVWRPITELVTDLKYAEKASDTKKIIKYFNPNQNTIKRIVETGFIWGLRLIAVWMTELMDW